MLRGRRAAVLVAALISANCSSILPLMAAIVVRSLSSLQQQCIRGRTQLAREVAQRRYVRQHAGNGAGTGSGTCCMLPR